MFPVQSPKKKRRSFKERLGNKRQIAAATIGSNVEQKQYNVCKQDLTKTQNVTKTSKTVINQGASTINSHVANIFTNNSLVTLTNQTKSNCLTRIHISPANTLANYQQPTKIVSSIVKDTNISKIELPASFPCPKSGDIGPFLIKYASLNRVTRSTQRRWTEELKENNAKFDINDTVSGCWDTIKAKTLANMIQPTTITFHGCRVRPQEPVKVFSK